MNKKVAQTVIYLIWLFLIAFACIKFFFGEWYAIQLDNENIINLGKFVDSYEWLRQILFYISSYVTYFLYLCACLQKWNLKPKQLLCLGILLAIIAIIVYFVPNTGNSLDLICMVLLPCIWGANYKQVAVIFTAHYCSQLLSLYTRSLPLLCLSVDFATQLILCIDGYFWLFTYYLYANTYKEKLLWDELCLRFMAINQKMKSLRKSKGLKPKETESKEKSQNLKMPSDNNETVDQS